MVSYLLPCTADPLLKWVCFYPYYTQSNQNSLAVLSAIGFREEFAPEGAKSLELCKLKGKQN